MRNLLVLVAAIPAITFGQGLSLTAPGQTGGGKVLASFPLTTSGPLITEDSNTVAHVYWNGTALVDTKGNAWTQNGTVPQVTANPFTTTRYGAGPFSASNQYRTTAVDDVFDFAGDFTVCVVYSGGLTNENLIVAWASNQGWYLNTGFGIGTDATNLVAAGISYGPVNILCGGRSGGNVYVKPSLQATTSAARTQTPRTGTSTYIGTNSTPAFPFTGTIYEVWATTSAWNEATVTAIQQKVLGHYATGQYSPLAVTRATLATYENPAGTVWTVPANVARITSSGLLRERASTNYVLNSRTHAKAAQATATLPTGTYVGRHTGTGTMTIAAGTATMADVNCTAVAPGTLCPFTVTVTGTAAITTEAGVTRAQIEPGTVTDYTSWIDTAGTAVVRNVDDISATVPSAPGNWCIAGTFQPYSGTWPNALSLWTLGDTYTAANTASSWGNSSIYIVDAASGAKDLGDYTDPVAPWRVVTCDKSGALSLAVNGVMVDDSATGAGTGVLTTPKTTLRFGSQASGGTASTMFIKNVSLWKASKTKEVK